MPDAVELHRFDGAHRDPAHRVGREGCATRADGQDGHGQRLRLEEGPDAVALGEHRPVEARGSTPPIASSAGPRELAEVGVDDGAGHRRHRGERPLGRARRKRLRVTPLGFEVLREGEAIFDELRGRWAEQIGARELAAVEARLTALVGLRAVRADAPGWTAESPG